MREVRIAPPGPKTVVLFAVVVVLLALVLLRTCGSALDRRAAVPRQGREAAVLEIVEGADTVTVAAGDLGGDLAVVTTLQQGRVRPVAEMAVDGRLRVWTEDEEGPGAGDDDTPVAVTVRLERDVRWDVVVGGGAKRVTLDLSGVRAGSIEQSGGADSVDAILPVPDGELVTRITGGAGSVTLHAPGGVPASVTFGDGAGSATVDGDRRQGIAPGTTIASRDWSDTATNRLVVEVPVGVGSLTLDRRS